MPLGKLAITKFLDPVAETDLSVELVQPVDGTLVKAEQAAPRAGETVHRFFPSQKLAQSSIIARRFSSRLPRR